MIQWNSLYLFGGGGNYKDTCATVSIERRGSVEGIMVSFFLA